MTVAKEIIEAVLKTRKTVKPLLKDDNNPHGGYTYASIDAYYLHIAKAATECGLIWRTRETEYTLLDGYGRTKDRTFVKAKFAVDLYAGGSELPEYMTCTIVMPLDGAQTTGQLFSYADKVFMRVAFAVATGEADADAGKPEAVVSTKVTVSDPILGGSTVIKDATGNPVQANNMPVDGQDKPLSHDTSDGVIVDLPPEQAALAPKFKDGVPLVDTRKINPAAVPTIETIFKTFIPLVKTKKQLRDWHAENLAAIEKVKTLDPEAHDRIKTLFNERNKEVK